MGGYEERRVTKWLNVRDSSQISLFYQVDWA